MSLVFGLSVVAGVSGCPAAGDGGDRTTGIDGELTDGADGPGETAETGETGESDTGDGESDTGSDEDGVDAGEPTGGEPMAVCGNGVLEADEACDGAELDGMDCASVGLLGTLDCDAACQLDTSGCYPQSETLDFPIETDFRFIAAGPHPWHVGDYYEGDRTTELPSFDRLDVHLELDFNELIDCTQEAEVTVNGQVVGTLVLVGDATTVDATFQIEPALAGPDYTIRYETIVQPLPNCGVAGYDEVNSTITVSLADE